MLLAIDIGNTLIKIGAYKGDKLEFVHRIKTNAEDTSEFYISELNRILLEHGYSIKDVSGVAISSVAPICGNNMTAATKKVFNVEPVVISPDLDLGIGIKLDNPKKVGMDLIIGAVAAKGLYKLPAIIFDFGTATTAGVIDKHANFLGGALLPGIETSANILFANTALLPSIVVDVPEKAIGSDTITAINSGIVFGAVAFVDEMSERIEEELGEKATIILTGGLAHKVYGHTKRNVVICDNLNLEGLRIVYERNNI